MPSTAIQITNRALGHLGVDDIISFTQDTLESRTADLYYESTKREMFSSYYWNFATNYTTLTFYTDSFQQPFWEYKFLVPGDCAKIIAAYDSSGCPVHYEVLGKYVLANVDEIVFEYCQFKNEHEFPYFFESALEWYLAFKMSTKLTEDDSKRAQLFEISQRYLKEAKMIDAQENGKISLITDENSNLLRGRFNY